MSIHGLQGYDERFGDLTVGSAAREKPQNLDLTTRQARGGFSSSTSPVTGRLEHSLDCAPIEAAGLQFSSKFPGSRIAIECRTVGSRLRHRGIDVSYSE